MSFYVYIEMQAPSFIASNTIGYEERVPDVTRRVEISDDYSYGRNLLDPDEQPLRLNLQKRVKQIPPIFMSNNGMHIVQQPIFDLLQEMEPGAHQFLPMEVSSKDGEPLPEPCHILNVTQRQDSIIDELSEVRENSGGGGIMHIAGFRKSIDLTLRKSSLSPDVHLWREQRYPGTLFMSDALHEALKQRKLRFFEPVKVKEA